MHSKSSWSLGFRKFLPVDELQALWLFRPSGFSLVMTYIATTAWSHSESVPPTGGAVRSSRVGGRGAGSRRRNHHEGDRNVVWAVAVIIDMDRNVLHHARAHYGLCIEKALHLIEECLDVD